MVHTDPRFDRSSRRTEPGAWATTSRRGVVAAAHYLAADAGSAILAAGGNAVDAAIGTALALNVCEPAASGLGGMAMALVHTGGGAAPEFYSGACLAPAAATPELIAESHRYRGYRAVAVPAAPALWAALHARHGRLPLSEIAAPAVGLARSGCPVTALQHDLATSYRTALRQGNAADQWLGADGRPLPVGTVVPQPALADTLERLGRSGLMDFYHGEIAREIHADIASGGGFVTFEDLAAVREPTATAAIRAPFCEATLFTAGPPAGGLALAQLAAMATAVGRPLDVRRPRDLLLAVEMVRRVRRDRQRYRLRIGSDTLAGAAELLSAESATAALRDVRERIGGTGETSHLCVMDAAGTTVAMTVSIERCFGAACMNPRLGFLYNGYLRGFKIRNARHPHFLRPGVPARSNAAPTIVLGADGTITALGSTGSERMVSGIFTTLLRLPFEGVFDAVAGPRVHATPEGDVLAETGRLPDDCREALAGRYRVIELEPWSFKFGGLQLAQRRGDRMTGVGEPRRDAWAAAPEA